jgi:hypothetical protein
MFSEFDGKSSLNCVDKLDHIVKGLELLKATKMGQEVDAEQIYSMLKQKSQKKEQHELCEQGQSPPINNLKGNGKDEDDIQCTIN